MTRRKPHVPSASGPLEHGGEGGGGNEDCSFSKRKRNSIPSDHPSKFCQDLGKITHGLVKPLIIWVDKTVN